MTQVQLQLSQSTQCPPLHPPCTMSGGLHHHDISRNSCSLFLHVHVYMHVYVSMCNEKHLESA